MAFTDRVEEMLAEMKPKYRKPADQSCRTPLTRKLIGEMISVCAGNDSPYKWLQGFVPIWGKHGKKMQPDDGRLQMQLASTGLLDAFGRSQGYTAAMRAEELGVETGLEILKAVNSGMEKRGDMGVVAWATAKQLQRIDPLAVVHAGHSYRHRAAVLTEILDTMDKLPWGARGGSIVQKTLVPSPEKPKSDLLALSVTNKFVLAWVQRPDEDHAKAIVLDRDCLVTVRDTVLVRSSVLQVSEACSQQVVSEVPSPAQIRQVFADVDGLMEKYGDKAFGLVKDYETLCVATALSIHDQFTDRHAFLKQTSAACVDTMVEEGVSLADARAAVRNLCATLRDAHEVHLLCELYGLNRAWGSATVEPDQAFAKAEKLMTKKGELSISGERVMREAAGALTRMLCVEHLTKTGRLPPVAKLPTSNKRLRSWFKEEKVDLQLRGTGAPTLLDWAEVELDQMKSFDLVPDWTQLLQDKAISLGLHELAYMFSRDAIGVKGDAQHERRLLVEAWNSQTVNVEELFQRYWAKGFPLFERVFMMSPKEKQLDREVRMFTYSVLNRRIWNSVMERNLKEEIFPLIPSQTMTMSGTALLRKLLEPPSKTGSTKGSRFWRPTISLDFRKWCQQFFDGNTRAIGKIFDSVFGIAPTYANIQQEFGKCIFVRCHRDFPPELLVLSDEERRLPKEEQERILHTRVFKIVQKLSRGEHVDGMFMSNERGGEGISQKFWTAVTTAIIETVAEALGMDVETMAQGDNMILRLRIRVPDYIPIGMEYEPEHIVHLEAKVNRFMDELLRRTDAVSLPLKPAETWKSTNLVVYGKRWVYNSAVLPQVLKRIAKAHTCANAPVPDRNLLLGTAWSASGGAAETTASYMPCYLHACGRSALVQLQELLRSTCLPDAPKLFKFSQMKLPLKSYVTFHLCHPSVLGGGPICTPLHYTYRGHPDPLCESLAFLKLAGEGGLLEARQMLHAIKHRKGFRVQHLTSASSLVRDPTSIPVDGVSDPQRHMKAAIRTGLIRAGVVNHDLAPLAAEWVKTEDANICASLFTMRPLNPRVASEVWARSVPGAVEVTLGVFSAPVTLARVANIDRAVFESAYLSSEANLQAEHAFYLTASRLPDPDVSGICSSELAQELREEAVGGPVTGVTCPHPVEQARMRVFKPHDVPVIDKSHMVAYLDRSVRENDTGFACSSRGGSSGYAGCTTSAKVVGQVVHVRVTQRALRDAIRLVRNGFRCTKEGTLFRHLVMSISRTRNSADPWVLSSVAGTRAQGKDNHRLDDPRSDHAGSLNTNVTVSTRIFIETENLGPMCRSSPEIMAYLQGWIMEAVGRLVHHVGNEGLRGEDVVLVLEEGCAGCMAQVVNEEALDIAAVPGTLHTDRRSKILYSTQESFEAETAEGLLLGVPLTRVETLLSRKPEVEEAMGTVIMREGRRKTHSSVHPYAPPASVTREPPCVGIRFFADASVTLDRIFQRCGEDYIFENFASMAHWDKLHDGTTPAAVEVHLNAAIGPWYAAPFIPLLNIGEAAEKLELLCRHYGVRAPSQALAVDSMQFVRGMIAHHAAERLLQLTRGERGSRSVFCYSSEDASSVLRDTCVMVACQAARARDDREPDRTRRCFHAYTMLREATERLTGDFGLDDVQRELGRLVASFPADPRFDAKRRTASRLTAALRNTSDVHVYTMDPVMVIATLLGNTVSPNELARKCVAVKTEEAAAMEIGEDDEEMAKTQLEVPLPSMPEQAHDELYPLMQSIPLGARVEQAVEACCGTQAAADPCTDHVLRRAGYNSSSFYKLMYLILKECIPLSMVACLAEGKGSVLAMLVRDPRVRQAFYNSLTNQILFNEGMIGSYVPECLATLAPHLKKKIYGLSQSVRGPSDLLEHATEVQVGNLLDQMIARGKAEDEKAALTLVTCDIYFITQCHDALQRNYVAAERVAWLAAQRLSSDGCLLYKAFTVIPELLQAVLCAISLHFDAVKVVISPFSNGGTSEVYVVAQRPLPKQARGGPTFPTTGLVRMTSRLLPTVEEMIRTKLSFEKATCKAVRASSCPIGCQVVWNHIETHYPRRGRHELAILTNTSELLTPIPDEANKRSNPQKIAAVISWLHGVVDGHSKAILAVTAAEGAAMLEGQKVSKVDRDTARGRRKVTVPTRSSHAISCAYVMIDLLKARPANPVAYETVLRAAIQQDHPFMVRGTPWSTTVGIGEYLRRYGKQTAIAYGAYCGLSLKSWMHDRRTGERLYGQIGSTAMRSYDDVRHSAQVAGELADACFRILKEKRVAPHFVETTAGRGGFTAALLAEGARHETFSLVSFTTKPAELERWVRQRRVDRSRFTLRRMPFDTAAHAADLRGKVGILDIPWRMAGSFAGRPLRLLVEFCLQQCEVVFYTTAHGHRGLNIDGVTHSILAIAGRELVCCSRT